MPTDQPFSLALNDEQKDVRDWVHGFSQNVIRPAAAEWDEREETPWPVIQEATKIGLYGFEGMAQFYADPTGLTLPIVNEELFWGDAGIGMALMGTGLAVAAIAGQGTPEQMGIWIPQCFGSVDEPAVAAFCASEPNAGSDVSGIRTRAKLRRGDRRVGPQRPEGLGHQRRHLRRPRRDRVGRQGARLARPRRVRHPPRHPWPDDGHEGQEARPARLAHRGRLPRRLPRPGRLPARRQGEARRAPRARARGRQGQAAGGDGDLRGQPPDGRRAGDRHRARGLRVRAAATPRTASSSARRSSRTSRSRSRSPT